jgi:hypothetical protein
MAVKKAKIKPKAGDLIRIPLGDDLYGYARFNKDEGFAVFRFVDNGTALPDEVLRQPYAFYRYATESAVSNGQWPVISSVAFSSEEDGWTPPQASGYVPELGINRPTLYYRDESIPAKLDELIGKERFVVCHEPSLLVREIRHRLVDNASDLSEYVFHI